MRSAQLRFAAAIALAIAFLPLSAQSALTPPIGAIIARLQRATPLGSLAVSPDGKRLAWIEGSRGGGDLRVAPVDDLAKSRLLEPDSPHSGDCASDQPLWLPDSSALVYESFCSGDRQAEFYLERFDGRPARRLTTLQGEVGQAALSPDGRSLAFLYVPGASRPAGALAAMKAPSGVIGEDGIEVQRIALATLATREPAEPRLVTPENLHIYEFDWSPDSRALAYSAAEPPGENNWWIARLYTQPLSGAPHLLLAPAHVAGPLHGLQVALPRWSPDGKSIAFIGGLMSDQGVTGGDLWLAPVSGGAPIHLTPARPSTMEWFLWDSSQRLWATEQKGGKLYLSSFRLDGDPATGALKTLEDRPAFELPGAVGADSSEMSLSATRDRSRFLFRASSFEHAPEIYSLAPASADRQARALSHFNRSLEPVSGPSLSLDWSSDGFQVQGWLLKPAHYDPHKRYPMIVIVHGGPAYAETSHWNGFYALSPAAFSAAGYFVLLPNPRGSFGQGEAFTQANRKDFGHGDLRDILAGVDAVVARYPVDAHRVGITGWSYGGFMSMFAVTQTTRFRAAVAGAGISNWQSYYGENSIDQWMLPYFGASVYDDPAVYAKSSAISYIRQARTPTLIVVGDRDGECPAPQSFEFWHALRAQGVPTQLVVYPNEGHGFRTLEHSRDVLERALDWFAAHMPAEK